MIKFESEAEFEDFVIDNITEKKILDGLGITFKGNKKKLYQQYTLGSYGRTDLVIVDFQDEKILGFNIIELKNVKINTHALFQISRYVNGFQQLVRDDDRISNDVYIKGYLLGPGYEDDDWCYIYVLLNENINITTFSLDINTGVKFTQINKYLNKNTDFKCSLDPILIF